MTNSYNNPKYRKSIIGNWILLGKLKVLNTYCYLCGKKLSGEQLVYSNKKTGKNIAVCSKCVKEFEKQTNPRISRDPDNITVGQVENAIAYAWRCFDRYEKHNDPGDKKGTELYSKYQKAKEIAEGYKAYYPWLYPTGLPNPRRVFKPSVQKALDKMGVSAYDVPMPCPVCKKSVLVSDWYEHLRNVHKLSHDQAMHYILHPGLNPTLVMPIKSKKQLDHLFNAQSELAKAGVRFDSGTSIKNKKLHERDWELDWSLSGAYLRNPIRHTKQGWFWGNVGPQPTRKALLTQVRAIYASGYKEMNPEIPLYAIEGRFWNYKGRRYEKDSVWHTKKEANKQRNKLRNKGYLAETVFTVVGIIYAKYGTAYSVFKAKPRNKNPIDLYQSFHGNPPKGKRTVFYTPPNGPILKIGRLASIEYIPEPPSRHVGTRFTHEAGDLGHKVIRSNAILATNKKGDQLYIVKEKNTSYPRFSSRGILG